MLLFSCVQLFAIPWAVEHQASLSFSISQFAQIYVHWVNDVIQSSHPLSCPSPPALNLSLHQGLMQLSLCIRWPKYLGFNFSSHLSNEYSGLVSFRIDWFGLLTVQGNLKNLLQCHGVKASVLWCSAFFRVQFSYLYMNTGKKKKKNAWPNRHLSEKWSLCFLNTLSMFVIAFLPRSKHILISRLQSPSTVILEPKKMKPVTVYIFAYLFTMRTRCNDLSFSNVEF